MLVRMIFILLVLSCTACATLNPPLYLEFGGKERIAKVSEYFIDEVSFDADIYPYFKYSGIERFKEMFTAHLCQQLDGPCKYTGDTMVDVHRGMNINEADFNRVVELLMNAMDRANVPVTAQNRLLNKLAPMRAEIMSTKH